MPLPAGKRHHIAAPLIPAGGIDCINRGAPNMRPMTLLASRIRYRGEPLYHASLASSGYVALINGIGFEIIDHAVNDAPNG